MRRERSSRRFATYAYWFLRTGQRVYKRPTLRSDISGARFLKNDYEIRFTDPHPRNLHNLRELIKRFSAVKVLVVGDVMLDRYCWGDINRISPEAPVPVVALGKTSLTAGGAANVAANIAGLGAKPYLVGVTGKDADAALLPDVLRQSSVNKFSLTAFGDRRTTVKTRIVANNQHVVRIDDETTTPLNKREASSLFATIDKQIDGHDVILISDYAKGMLTVELLSRIIRKAKRKKKIVVVDPKGKDFSKYRGATVITPNEREAAEACHVEVNRQDLIDRAAKSLLDDLALEGLLITQGAKGMTLLQKGHNIVHLKASARKVFDVTGAGDTVIASLAVALGSGLDIVESREICKSSSRSGGRASRYYGDLTSDIGKRVRGRDA